MIDAPAETPPSREPQIKLGDEDKQKIRELLLRPDVKGNIAIAHKLLGVGYGALERFIARDPQLAALCPEKDPALLVPDETDMINRPELPKDELVILTSEQFAEYQAFVKQNRRLLQKDWEELGLTAEQAAKAQSYGRLGSAPLGQIIRMTHGQLIKNLMMLDEVVERDGKMILDGKIPEEQDAEGAPRDHEVVEREWRYALYAGMKLQLDIHGHLTKSQAIMAEALKKMQAALVNSKQAQRGKLAGSATPAPAKSEIDKGHA